MVRECYDTPLSGHPGADETIRSIRELFFSPEMAREIRRYVAVTMAASRLPSVYLLQAGARPTATWTATKTFPDRMGDGRGGFYGTLSPHKPR